MSPAERLNIADVIDAAPIGGLQLRLFWVSGFSLLMAGFVVQLIAYVGPEIIVEFGLPDGGPVGNIVAATNVGLLIGSLFFTVLADAIGRRPVLIIGTFWFATLTVLTGLLAQTAEQLMLLRFIGGLGMGSIIPNATALIGEYSPSRKRVTLMMTITVAFTAGAALAAFVAAEMMPRFGWRSVLYLGGAVPLVIAVLMVKWLPESLRFLTVRGRFREVGQWLARLDANRRIDPDAEYRVPEEGARGVPVVQLLEERRAGVTVLYWAANFTNLLNLYFLAGLLPTILNQTIDMDASSAAQVAGAMQLGGTIGTFGLAWMISRKGLTPMLTLTFGIAALAIAFIGSPSVLAATLWLTATVFIAGWCVIGGQPGLNAFAATFYPTAMRSTGIGWGLGIGRAGAIVGPWIGGQLLAMDWDPQPMFAAFAAPAAATMLIMAAIHFMTRSRARKTTP